MLVRNILSYFTVFAILAETGIIQNCVIWSDGTIRDTRNNYNINILFVILYQTIPGFNDPRKETFGKHCGKRRKCRLPAFSPFPTMFSISSMKNSAFWPSLICCLQMLSILNQFTILLFGKESKFLFSRMKMSICSCTYQVPQSARLIYGENKATGQKTRYPLVSAKNIYMFPGVPSILENAFPLLKVSYFYLTTNFVSPVLFNPLLHSPDFLRAPLGWLSGERVRLMTWWLQVRSWVEMTFLSGVFSPLTSAEACEKSSRWLWKEKLC